MLAFLPKKAENNNQPPGTDWGCTEELKLTWGWWWHCRDSQMQGVLEGGSLPGSELFMAAVIPQTSPTGNMVSLETARAPEQHKGCLGKWGCYMRCPWPFFHSCFPSGADEEVAFCYITEVDCVPGCRQQQRGQHSTFSLARSHPRLAWCWRGQRFGHQAEIWGSKMLPVNGQNPGKGMSSFIQAQSTIEHWEWEKLTLDTAGCTGSCASSCSASPKLIKTSLH